MDNKLYKMSGTYIKI